MTSNGIFQNQYKKLSDYIRQQGIEASCNEEFSKLDNNFSRVEYVLRIHLKAEQGKLLTPSNTAKDLNKALSLKTEGNKCFKNNKNALALSKYNNAILLAPRVTDDNLLAVLFANRSAVLFAQCDYENCLTDIELALQHGYADVMAYKLLTRRAKCYQFIASAEAFQQSMKAATLSLANANLNAEVMDKWSAELSKLSHTPKLVAKHTELESLNCTNRDFPALCHKVDVAEDNEFGRYIHSEDEIEAGSNILIEKPYCSVTLSNYFLTHCSHCQTRADITPYPCRGCADIVYCSEQCEQEAWLQYHQYECQHIACLRDFNVNMGHLALRTALKAGYKCLHDIADGTMRITAKHPYDSQDYLNVFNLEGHETDRASKDLFWRTYAAVTISHMCDIVKWAGTARDAVSVLATFILHHLQVMPCNAHEISELVYNVKRAYQSVSEEVGGGIYPTLSLFNHSCDPDVVRTFHRGNTCIMKALSPILKGKQVYDNYGVLYAVHDVKDRQLKVQSQYYFQCACVPCTHGWPSYSDLNYDDEPMYRCPNCKSLITMPEETHCENCEAPFNKGVVDNQLDKAKQTLDRHLSILFCDNLSSAAESDIRDKVRSCSLYSQLVNSLVFRPYKPLNDCQEALKHLYGLLGNHTTINQ